MTFRESQINVVLEALDYLKVTVKNSIKLTRKQLEKKLKDYDIPDAMKIELWTDGSVDKPILRNIIHNQPINRARFYTMIRFVSRLDEFKPIVMEDLI